MKLRILIAMVLALVAVPAAAQVNPGTQPLSGAKGGTNNGFMQFSGPAGSLKTYTLPNSNSTLAAINQIQIWTGAQSFTDSDLVLLGSSSGSVTLHAPATGGVSATFFSGTDTVAGIAAVQTLTNKTFAASTDILGAVTMGLGSDATGDIYYNNGGILTRLPIGSASNILAVSGGKPVWTPPTGGGNVSNTGTPTANQIAQWTNATTIQGVNLASLLTGSGLAVISGTTSPTIAVPAAVKTDQTTATSTSVAVVPGVQQFHPSAVKAWAIWTGSTTGTNAPTSGYNITSITRVSAGIYTVNFTTAFSAANSYACTSSTATGTSTAGIAAGPYAATPTASAYSLGTFGFTGTPTDFAFVQIHCSGTQ